MKVDTKRKTCMEVELLNSTKARSKLVSSNKLIYLTIFEKSMSISVHHRYAFIFVDRVDQA